MLRIDDIARRLYSNLDDIESWKAVKGLISYYNSGSYTKDLTLITLKSLERANHGEDILIKYTIDEQNLFFIHKVPHQIYLSELIELVTNDKFMKYKKTLETI